MPHGFKLQFKMKNIVIIGIVILGILGFIYSKSSNIKSNPQSVPQASSSTSKTSNIPDDISQTTVIAEGLDTPWAIAFLPDKNMLLTERAGRVRLIQDGKLQEQPVAALTQVKEIGEGGLLGITIDPDFSTNNFVYLYYTYSSSGDNTLNRVVRMTYQNNVLNDEKIIVDKIPGASNHNGGRIKFGPDKLLYITTGDAENPSQAQDKNTLGGKILRVKDGSVEVYSYGHRNPQGLAWDNQGNLWATEHGRSGVQSGLDEVNKIVQGKNYGWPTIQGNEKKDGMETPILNSLSDTWAPAGLAFLNSSFFFGGLRGQALYQAVVDGEALTLKEHFKNQFGRIREVILGPDNMLYITTSNKDGRGIPKSGDDKVIRINPAKL